MNRLSEIKGKILNYFSLIIILFFATNLMAKDFVIKLNYNNSKDFIKQNLSKHLKLNKFKHFKHLPKIKIVSADDSTTLIKLLKELKKNSSIEYFEEAPIYKLNKINYSIIPDDQLFTHQYWAKNSANRNHDISLDSAWAIATGDTNLLIATFDGAGWFKNGDFENLWRNSKEQLNGIDDDSNGYVDDINGWNFFDNNSKINGDTATHNIGIFHGYITSSIISSNHNSYGIAGVNPKSKIVPLRIFNDSGRTSLDAIFSACDYALSKHVKIINMSFGSETYSKSFDDVIDTLVSHNIIIVASTGNDDTNTVLYPAKYGGVIAVGATDTSYNRASFSNYGDSIDFVSVGTEIVTPTPWNPNSYIISMGTSFSTPIVTGIISLMLSINPDLTNNEVYNYLKNSSKDMVGNKSEDTQGYDKYYGWGAVDAYKALKLVKRDINHKPVANIKSFEIANDSNLGYNVVFSDLDGDSFEYVLKGDTSRLYFLDNTLYAKNLYNTTFDYELDLYDIVDTTKYYFSLKVDSPPYVYGEVYCNDTLYIGDTISKIIQYGDNDDSILYIIPTEFDSTIMQLDNNILTFSSLVSGTYSFVAHIEDNLGLKSSDIVYNFITINRPTTAVNSKKDINNYSNSIIAYPNPANRFIYAINPNVEIKIYNKYGNLMLKSKMSSIDLQNFKSDYYILKQNNTKQIIYLSK